MTPLEYPQILQMLAARQRRLEESESSLSEMNWLREVWIEAGPLARAIQVKDKDAALVAIVKVWAAMLAEWVANIPDDEDLSSAAGLFIATMTEPRYWGEKQEEALQARTNPLDLLDAFIHLTSMGSFNANIFGRVLELNDVSWTQLYDAFMKEAGEGTTILFTAEKREALRTAHKAAVDAGDDTFEHEGQGYVTTYAGYLLEFLDTKELSHEH